MLGMSYNISWKEHLINKSLYGKLPLISVKIQLRRIRLAGHYAKHTGENSILYRSHHITLVTCYKCFVHNYIIVNILINNASNRIKWYDNKLLI